jgi:hypothetical protein
MVYETYSKRQKRLRGENIDFYRYDNFPEAFKTQVVYIWNYALGNYGESVAANNMYKHIAEVLREEYGRFELIPNARLDVYNDLRQFFLKSHEAEQTLDVIELTFKIINNGARRFSYRSDHAADKKSDQAIENLNTRFREHSLGFQFLNNELMRIDSELIHVEVVKPLLSLLNKPYFRGAEDEYLSAHEHYRHGNGKEALNDCLKSFESLMMGICEKRGWAYGKKDTSKTLIDICLKNGLIPDFWQSQLGGLRSMLEGAIPTGRNRLAGHGQGADPTEVPLHLVSYMLHMTASTLKFLVEADAAMT